MRVAGSFFLLAVARDGGFSWHGCAVCLREGLASVRRRSTLVYLDALSAPRALYGE